MRKLFGIVIAFLMLFSVAKTANTVSASSLSDSLIMQLSENHSNSQIEINVKMVANTGVSGMTLELVYNRDVFEYVGFEQGNALSNMDLMTTGSNADLLSPIKFNWFNQNVTNDFSTGNMLKLNFALKQDVQSGDYEIGFKYEDGDITYIDDYMHTPSKNAIIGKAIISVEENKISETKFVNNSDNNTTLFIILGVAVGVVLCSAVASIVIIRTNRKKRKQNWLKI